MLQWYMTKQYTFGRVSLCLPRTALPGSLESTIVKLRKVLCFQHLPSSTSYPYHHSPSPCKIQRKMSLLFPCLMKRQYLCDFCSHCIDYSNHFRPSNVPYTQEQRLLYIVKNKECIWTYRSENSSPVSFIFLPFGGDSYEIYFKLVGSLLAIMNVNFGSVSMTSDKYWSKIWVKLYF